MELLKLGPAYGTRPELTCYITMHTTDHLQTALLQSLMTYQDNMFTPSHKNSTCAQQITTTPETWNISVCSHPAVSHNSVLSDCTTETLSFGICAFIQY